MRVGIGHDAHCLVEGRKLFLGGVEVPHSKGLLGHSDGDCLIHAIIDALFGAACCGDIGTHFPPSDDTYKGIYSIELLEKSVEIIKQHGFEIENIDATVVAQAPKLAPYIPLMREKIASACDKDADCISVKATTTEHMGYEGREEGMSAIAVCLLK
ncbi:MAG: 2-C-methyl-D-erythritol 2,4-cyclodiphosphate synthase [Clostridia bacterium]|nr:2-C-methyl-D-erythritol 2,4-cyclodiphosphate synthase [Clostridia bacterium]